MRPGHARLSAQTSVSRPDELKTRPGDPQLARNPLRAAASAALSWAAERAQDGRIAACFWTFPSIHSSPQGAQSPRRARQPARTAFASSRNSDHRPPCAHASELQPCVALTTRARSVVLRAGSSKAFSSSSAALSTQTWSRESGMAARRLTLPNRAAVALTTTRCGWAHQLRLQVWGS